MSSCTNVQVDRTPVTRAYLLCPSNGCGECAEEREVAFLCAPHTPRNSKRVHRRKGLCLMSDQPNWSQVPQLGHLLNRMPPLSDDETAILVAHLILTARTLQSSIELLETCSREGWGSPSELRGTVARFRLCFSLMVSQRKTMSELLNRLTTISPRLQMILIQTSECLYVVEDWFWESLNPDLANLK